MARIISITSGKGGVGKTNLAVNLGIRLGEQGFKTCLFDADLGLANINILLGLVPEYTLVDLIEGQCCFTDLLIKNIHGMDIIPGSTGVSMLADLGPTALDNLIGALSDLEDYDYILLDTSAGISKQVIAFCMAATHVIVTLIPEPTSLTDAYSLLKVLYKNGFDKSAFVLVNRSKNKEFGQRIFNKFRDTVQKFLPLTIHSLGSLNDDPQVSEAVARQTPFVRVFPQCMASLGIKEIAERLRLHDAGVKDDNSMDLFLHRMMDYLREPVKHTSGYERQAKASILHEKHDRINDNQKALSIQGGDLSKDLVEKDEMVSQILMALNSLVKHTEQISEDVAAMKKNMELRQNKNQDRGEKKSESPPTVPVIDLDFEKYVIGARRAGSPIGPGHEK
ncbi:MAG: MinD/ParA family protein [Proteobacteria bacterium]|nr:MinD/ParA family protein [Pseudomonadota bacterium]